MFLNCVWCYKNFRLTVWLGYKTHLINNLQTFCLFPISASRSKISTSFHGEMVTNRICWVPLSTRKVKVLEVFQGDGAQSPLHRQGWIIRGQSVNCPWGRVSTIKFLSLRKGYLSVCVREPNTRPGPVSCRPTGW